MSAQPNFIMDGIAMGQSIVRSASAIVVNVGAAAHMAIYETDKLIRRAQVSTLTPSEIERVRALYTEADIRHDGSLDKQELRHALFNLTNKWLTEAEMDAFWLEVDEDGNDAISFEEFLAHAGPILFPPVTHQLMRTAAEQAARIQHIGTSIVEEAAYRSADPVVDLVVDRVEQLIVEVVVDLDMPRVIQAASRRLIKSAVRDLRIEVKEITKHNIRQPEAKPDPVYKYRVGRWAHMLRGAVLYTLFPYDKSIWVQIKDPWFLLLKVISIYPPPVQPIFFIIQFALMDHWDEFQLVRFILLFKSSQFISIGLISTFVGAYYYFAADGEEVIFPISIFSIALFLAQVVVVWLAFVLLPCSKEKGRKGTQAENQYALDEDEVGVCCGITRYKGRGGRIAILFVYDVVCFLALAGFALWSFQTTDVGPDNRISAFGDFTFLGIEETIAGTNRRFAESLYWARTFYSVLALPFMLFTLPVLGDLLTHTLPTAYDRFGRTLPVLDAQHLAAKARERHSRAERRASERQLAGLHVLSWMPFSRYSSQRRKQAQTIAENAAKSAALTGTGAPQAAEPKAATPKAATPRV